MHQGNDQRMSMRMFRPVVGRTAEVRMLHVPQHLLSTTRASTVLQETRISVATNDWWGMFVDP
jgi:hypothetical protein